MFAVFILGFAVPSVMSRCHCAASEGRSFTKAAPLLHDQSSEALLGSTEALQNVEADGPFGANSCNIERLSLLDSADLVG